MIREASDPEHHQESALKIIAVTGHIEKKVIEQAKECGINDVYTKPLNFKLLGKILVKTGFINHIPDLM